MIPPHHKIRQSNIELLRIIAILGVIVLHYNNETIGGGLKYALKDSAQYMILCCLESAAICAVDLFILISGYFLCTVKQRRVWKLVELIIQVIVYSLCTYVIKVYLGEYPMSLRSIVGAMVPANWFVILYCALYLISPFLNVLIENLTLKQMRQGLIMVLMLFACYPTLVDIFEIITDREWMGLSTISAYGSQRGYTIVNFVLMYSVGAYLRLGKPWILNWKKRKMIVVYLTCSAILTIWALRSDDTSSCWSYCNPIVIIMAVMVFCLFYKLDMGEVRWINRLAEGVFSVYLLHSFFFRFADIQRFVASSPPILLAHVLISAIGIYFACWFVHMVYCKLEKPVYRVLSNRIRINFVEF